MSGPAERQILELAGRVLHGFFAKPRFDPDVMDTYPYPAFDLQSRVNYVPLSHLQRSARFHVTTAPRIGSFPGG